MAGTTLGQQRRQAERGPEEEPAGERPANRERAAVPVASEAEAQQAHARRPGEEGPRPDEVERAQGGAGQPDEEGPGGVDGDPPPDEAAGLAEVDRRPDDQPDEERSQEDDDGQDHGVDEIGQQAAGDVGEDHLARHRGCRRRRSVGSVALVTGFRGQVDFLAMWSAWSSWAGSATR